MTDRYCLILHRKSANRPEIKAAVKAARLSPYPVRLKVPGEDTVKGKMLFRILPSHLKVAF